MTTDQPAQGSTADYCSRWPGEPHAMSSHVRGGAWVSVRRCDSCGWIDFTDLDEQIVGLLAGQEQVLRGLAEGRRQATEGWEREMRYRWVDGNVAGAPAEPYVDAWLKSVQRVERMEHGVVRGELQRRLVGPWEPDEQPEEDPWRLAEWAALPDECFIDGCSGSDIDQRGPVFIKGGLIRKACVEHWEPIFRVLGEQAAWERTDAMASGPAEPVSGDVVERMSAETIASVLAMVDAPYRPGLNVEFDDEPEGGA